MKKVGSPENQYIANPFPEAGLPEARFSASRLARAILGLYLLLLIRVIVFKYPLEQMQAIVSGWSKEVIWQGMHTANFTLFRTIRMYIRYADRLNSFENLVGNIVAFVPFGFFLPQVIRKGRRFWVMLLNAFVFVVGIEVFQLLSAFGAFDVDDILLNCFGAVIGWGGACVIDCYRLSSPYCPANHRRR